MSGSSETSRVKSLFERYCKGYGLDIGAGGDKIVSHAISVDLPRPYTKVGEDPVQLGGDARNLMWFTSETLDFVYSSHLLEDFPESETVLIMLEWLRVIKKGGYFCLYLPDQQLYLAHCKKDNTLPNQAHKNDNFSSDFIKRCANQIGLGAPILDTGIINSYSFGLVWKVR